MTDLAGASIFADQPALAYFSPMCYNIFMSDQNREAIIGDVANRQTQAELVGATAASEGHTGLMERFGGLAHRLAEHGAAEVQRHDTEVTFALDNLADGLEAAIETISDDNPKVEIAPFVKTTPEIKDAFGHFRDLLHLTTPHRKVRLAEPLNALAQVVTRPTRSFRAGELPPRWQKAASRSRIQDVADSSSRLGRRMDVQQRPSNILWQQLTLTYPTGLGFNIVMTGFSLNDDVKRRLKPDEDPLKGCDFVSVSAVKPPKPKK